MALPAAVVEVDLAAVEEVDEVVGPVIEAASEGIEVDSVGEVGVVELLAVLLAVSHLVPLHPSV